MLDVISKGSSQWSCVHTLYLCSFHFIPKYFDMIGLGIGIDVSCICASQNLILILHVYTHCAFNLTAMINLFQLSFKHHHKLSLSTLYWHQWMTQHLFWPVLQQTALPLTSPGQETGLSSLMIASTPCLSHWLIGSQLPTLTLWQWWGGSQDSTSARSPLKDGRVSKTSRKVPERI